MIRVGASLTVTPIGVGAAYARVGEAQSCYLVRFGEAALVLDMGAGALAGLREQISVEQIDLIAISHLHPDHCAGLFALQVYLAHGPGKGTRIPLIGPATLPERFCAFDGGDDWTDVFVLAALDPDGGEIDAGEALRVRYAPVPHTGMTFAFRVDGGGGSVTYGADCRMNDALVALAEGSRVLILETGNGPGPSAAGSIHLSGEDAGVLAHRAGVDELLLTHCFPDHDRDATLAAARRAFSGSVRWAEQGVEVVASAG
jgi:ribonuclease BN (tRNA processing enzyme)